MTSPFKKSGELTSQGTPTLPSSMESQDSPKPSSSPDGQPTGKCGQSHVLARATPSPESGLETKTQGISGRKLIGSSASAALTQFLASKSRQRLDSDGSIEYSMTWKEKVTPAGRSYFQLVASARPTSERVSTGSPKGWPTPVKKDADSSARGTTTTEAMHPGTTLTDAARLAGWPTPRTPTGGAESAERKKELGRVNSGGGDLQAVAKLAGWPPTQARDGDHRGGQAKRMMEGKRRNLPDAAKLAGWVTPSSRDWKDTPGMATEATNPDGTPRTRLDQLPRQAALAGWTTPRATDPKAGHHYTDKMTGKSLTMDASLAGWNTPRATDGSNGGPHQANGALPADAAKKASGAIQSSFPAPTGKRGVLNPALSAWLMAIPSDWLMVVPLKVRRGSRC